jgi:hypothetical protein
LVAYLTPGPVGVGAAASLIGCQLQLLAGLAKVHAGTGASYTRPIEPGQARAFATAFSTARFMGWVMPCWHAGLKAKPSHDSDVTWAVLGR